MKDLLFSEQTMSTQIHTDNIFVQTSKRLLNRRQTYIHGSFKKQNENQTKVKKFSISDLSKSVFRLSSCNSNKDNFTKINSQNKFSINLPNSANTQRKAFSGLKERSKSTILSDYELKKYRNHRGKTKEKTPPAQIVTTPNSNDFLDSHPTNCSITDFCLKPKNIRFTSKLSIEAQYALIKTYEDMIYFEILPFSPVNIDTLMQKNLNRFKNNENLIRNFDPLDENVNTEKKRDKLRYSHYIESAQYILDTIESFKIWPEDSSKNTVRLIEENAEINTDVTMSKKNLNIIISMFSKWTYLWTKEYKGLFQFEES